MNVEMKDRSSSNAKDGDSFKEAKTKRSQGDSELKTSCITCKFKPNCEDAIPFYNGAAELYHGASQYNDEIYCREKLIFCYNFLKSLWEEGNENEKVAFIYLNNLDKNELAFKFIQNTYQSFFVHGDYKDSVMSVTKLGKAYFQKNELDFAERCLKIAYDAFLQTFHTLATKDDEPYEFLYNSFDDYLSILYANNKVRVAIESCENVLKVIEQYEQNKTRIVHVYGFLLISLIVNEDVEKFEPKAEVAKSACVKNSDYRFIENIINLHNNVREAKENSFRDNMIEVNVDYPVEVGKKLNSLFMEKKNLNLKNVSNNNNENNNYQNDFQNFNNNNLNDDDDLVVVVNDKNDESKRSDYL